MSAARPTVVVTRRLPDPVEARLAERFDVHLNRDDVPLSASELAAAMRTADALLTTVTDRIDRTVIGSAPRARIIANFGVGFEHIDIAAAGAAGVAVTNTPGVLTDDTADLTIALMLGIARRLGEGERELRSGRWTSWRPTHLLGTRVSGATLGIVGFGRIGRAVAARAHHGFGMSIIVHTRGAVDPALASELELTVAPTLDALLASSDVVTVHVPSTPATRHMIDADRLAAMRPGAYLVNTARGDVVDTGALIDALERGTIGGAALDVYENEPNVDPRLLAMDNVMLIPHLGSATTATRIAMGNCAAANLEAFFDGSGVPNPVRA